MTDARLIGVYRFRNADRALRLAEPALAEGWQVAWWALDRVAEELAAWTVGSGAGVRLVLLNEILRRVGPRRRWLVVSDDDLAFVRGDVVELVSLCDRAGFDLAQPARADSSPDHEITVARRLSRGAQDLVRRDGPLFVVGPSFSDRIVPFPEERGMGWGLELEWFDLQREGCVLGIVDAMPVRHEGARGLDYDAELEVAKVHEELAARGLASWSDVQQTLETWRPWQRSPGWAT